MDTDACVLCGTSIPADDTRLTLIFALETNSDPFGDPYLVACERHGQGALASVGDALPRDDGGWVIIPGYERQDKAYVPKGQGGMS